MKAYIGNNGAEWSSLIFANSAREAKKLFWNGWGEDYSEWIDVRVNLLDNQEYFMGLMIGDTPYIDDEPRSCDHCGCWWGKGIINADFLCESCAEEVDG